MDIDMGDTDLTLKPEWRRILECRSVKDKIGIAIDCDLFSPDDADVVAELVLEGYMIWIDRTTLRHLAAMTKTGTIRIGLKTDVFLLTPKGIALCEEHGIKQQ